MTEQRMPRYTGGYNNSGAPDSVRRVGAGGVKPGLPLIITGGSERYNLFHYNFTETGKIKRPPRQGEMPLQASATGVPKREIAEKFKYKLPRNFCPDCDRNDRQHEKGSINVWTMYDGAADIGLKPGEVVVSFWCQECQMNALYGKRVLIPGEEKGIDPENLDEWRKKQIRACRMDRNISNYIRNRLIAGDFSIIIDRETKEAIEKA